MLRDILHILLALAALTSGAVIAGVLSWLAFGVLRPAALCRKLTRRRERGCKRSCPCHNTPAAGEREREILAAYEKEFTP